MKGELPNGSKISDTQDIARWAQELPRIDQITDAVGPTSSDQYLCVYEDSLFGRLVGSQLNLNPEELTRIFRDVSERSDDIMKKWLSLSTERDIELVPVYTSDIEPELAEYVQKLSEEVKDPTILRKEKSKINMMYTYLWPFLLREKEYLPDENVLCSEPVQHFLEVALPNNEGYYGIDGFLRNNAWGYGKNSQLQAAGFIPSVSVDKQGFSRQERSTDVTNRSNGRQRLTRIYQQALAKPFPLNKNPIIREAVNMLFPFAYPRDLFLELKEMEEDFNQRRKGKKKGSLLGNITNSAKVKNEFNGDAIKPLEQLAEDVERVYTELGFSR